jgi:exopolysaccharide biosynthesis WecB/TagA/CpsF family protein
MQNSSSKDSRNPPLAKVDGWSITSPTLPAAIAEIAQQAADGRSFTVFTLNLDHIVKLRRDPAFRAAYETASLVTADGAPVAWLSRRQSPAICRTTGADLLLPLIGEAAARQIPIYLFGASGSALAKASRAFADRTNGLIDIAGTDAPSAGFDPAGREADAAIARIAASGARLAFIALGAPKQEIFAARAKAQGVACGFICVGAAIDFIAGEQVRAPEFMQRTGTEWLWRLATNPRRLALRYASCAVIFADLALIRPLRLKWAARTKLSTAA